MSREKVLEAESLLSNLGYWTGTVDGRLDEITFFAVMSFQRVSSLPPTAVLSEVELQALRTAKPFMPRTKGKLHVEVNLTNQTLYLVSPEGTVSHILPVNTGSGKMFTQGGWTRRARTPTGTFTVYRKIDGWRKSPLGMMYYPSYLYGGVAIHGSEDIPKYPSTHGCIAVPLFAAEELSSLLPIDTIVEIYRGSPKSRRPAGVQLKR